MNMSITIAIPTYNRPTSVDKLLRTLSPQLGRDDELLIVDDGFESICEAELQNVGHTSIRYVKHQSNWGMVPTWNHCLRLASKEWICIVHDDDDVSSKAIELLKRAISLQVGPAVISAEVNQGDDSDPFRYTFSEPGRWAVLNGPTTPSGVTVHRDIVGALGCFNESFAYSSDLEYFPRLLAQYPLMRIEGASVVRYQLHDANHQYVTWTKPDFLSQLSDIEDAVASYAGLGAARAKDIRGTRWRAYLTHMFYCAARLRSKELLKLSSTALARTGRLGYRLRFKVFVAQYLGLIFELPSFSRAARHR